MHTQTQTVQLELSPSSCTITESSLPLHTNSALEMLHAFYYLFLVIYFQIKKWILNNLVELWCSEVSNNQGIRPYKQVVKRGQTTLGSYFEGCARRSWLFRVPLSSSEVSPHQSLPLSLNHHWSRWSVLLTVWPGDVFIGCPIDLCKELCVIGRGHWSSTKWLLL